jgi:hypothetical protein
LKNGEVESIVISSEQPMNPCRKGSKRSNTAGVLFLRRFMRHFYVMAHKKSGWLQTTRTTFLARHF